MGPAGQIPWGFTVPLSDPQAGKPDKGFRTFTIVWELLWYCYSPVCGSPTWWVWDFILSILHSSYLLIAASSLTLDVGYLFVGGFQCPPADGCSISSVQFSRSVVSDCLWPHESHHARPPCPSPTPGVYSNSCPLSRWCHPAISSSVIPFSSCPQSLTASGSFPMSQLFAWGGQSIGVSASVSVLPMNTQDWSPLGWTGWISWQSKGLSKVFSNTTVQKHQFFSAQLSL